MIQQNQVPAPVPAIEEGRFYRVFDIDLDSEASSVLINESRLVDRLSALDDIWENSPFDSSEVYWLTLARINELALWSAGRYVDNGELGAAGDLLFNPRTIWVWVKGESHPVVKERHTAMTAQFRERAGGVNVKHWLKWNTCIEHREKPILAELLERLEGGGRMDPDYLQSVKTRHVRVTEAINMVVSCCVPEDMDFQEFLWRTSSENRAVIESALCGFDLKLFWAMGREIQNMIDRPDHQSPFLV